MSTDWSLAFNGGGKLRRKGHVLSADGRFAIAVFSTHLKVYSLATRQSIRNIDVGRTLEDVTDTCMSRTNPQFVFLFTATNEVLVVNWRDRIEKPMVSSYQMKVPESMNSFGHILRFVTFDEGKKKDGKLETGFVLVVGKPIAATGTHGRTYKTLKKGHTRRIVRFTAVKKEPQEPVELASLKDVITFGASSDRRNLVFVSPTNVLYHTRLTRGGEDGFYAAEMHEVTFKFRYPVSCCAISNGELPMIALGTNYGPIELLYLSQSKPDYGQRFLRWHTGGVNTVAFGVDGTHLLSGGPEKVLVFWQLETDKQQFLPRLNGPILDIQVDMQVEQYYGLTLDTAEDQIEGLEHNHVEWLVLNALDLTSKIDVNGLRPQYAINVEKTMQKDDRRIDKLQPESVTRLQHSYTSTFQINPRTKSMYLPEGPRVQVFDIERNEQVMVTALADSIQQGKVMSELEIRDPYVKQLVFSPNGLWMCTFDMLETPHLDQLMSTNDVKYSLKFWRYVEKPAGASYWQLCTKVLDPHGINVPITAVVAAPKNYHNGNVFVTADNKGGLRLWRPRAPRQGYETASKVNPLQPTAWTIRKVRNGMGRLETPAVSLAWSEDGSVIALGVETSIVLVDPYTLEDLAGKPLPSLGESRFRDLQIVGTDLIVLTKHKLLSFSLVDYRTNELTVRAHSPVGGEHLLAVDSDRGRVCFCVNYYSSEKNAVYEHPIRSRVFVFDSHCLRPVYIADHPCAVSCVQYSSAHSAFVILDVDARIGTLNTVTSQVLLAEEERKHQNEAYEMTALLSNAEMMAKAVSKHNRKNQHLDEEEMFSRKPLNPDAFEPILQTMEGIPVEVLFERVLSII